MSNIDKRALREAAANAKIAGEAPVMPFDQRITALNDFLKHCTPETVLALLDELEAKDKAWSAQDNHINQQADRIESLEKKNGELGRALGAAEKLIAELEVREVREDGNQFLVVRHPGKLPVIKHSAGDLEGFLRQLLEHDSMATIDIVTHRYYGVGGQWVQDADEYLQMMAVAAGKGEAS